MALEVDTRVEPGRFTTTEVDGLWPLKAEGRWDIRAVARLDPALRQLDPGPRRRALIDLSALVALDSAGAWAINRTRQALRQRGIEAEYRGGNPAHVALINRLETCTTDQPTSELRPPPLIGLIERFGAGVWNAGLEARHLIAFFGIVLATIARSLVQPRRVRMTAVTLHLERAALNAIPIVGLLSFLIGIVLAYQGVEQLRRFGAEVFTVNLAGISILREIGVLITAILIAGRSGSAFTAQIGTMRVRDEIDAMQTIGLDPIELLALPRILALVLGLPLLTFYADLMGLFGGAVSLLLLLEVPFSQFLDQLQQNVPVIHLWVGLAKAPVFAFLIGLTGCYHGFRVRHSAKSVGQLTTRSVVVSIFLVIVVDALFSIAFMHVGL